MNKITEEYLFNKYSTGSIYTSPAAIHFTESELKTSYWCSGPIRDILNDYRSHLSNLPINRCVDLLINEDGVLRCKGLQLTDEEKEWLWIEYKLYNALNNMNFNDKINFVVRK